MARNRSITVSVLALSLFFALATARVPLDAAEDGHGSTNLLESDSKTTTNTLLLLPSDPEPAAKIESDQVREPWIPDLTELEAINNSREAASLEAQTAPLRLRPINRHFFPKRPFFVRRNRRRCHDHMVRAWAQREQISYGNDMVKEGSGEGGEKRPLVRPRFWIVRPIEVLPRWNGERQREDDEEVMMIGHHHRHHHHHHHHHNEDGDRREDDVDRHDHHEEREEEMGGRGRIFKGIRKFLDHF